MKSSSALTEPDRQPASSVLVDAAWLEARLHDPAVRVVEVDVSRRDEGHPVSSQPSEPAVAGYVLPGPDPRVRAGHAAVRDAIGRPGRTLLDVRSRDEYRGERFWPSGGLEPGGQAGHVPSAVHQPIDGLYDERGAFADVAALRGVFSAVDPDSADELITYCTIGGRACTAWFVLTYLLGREGVRVYDGSWAEWGRMPGAPVEQA